MGLVMESTANNLYATGEIDLIAQPRGQVGIIYSEQSQAMKIVISY